MEQGAHGYRMQDSEQEWQSDDLLENYERLISLSFHSICKI